MGARRSVSPRSGWLRRRPVVAWTLAAAVAVTTPTGMSPGAGGAPNATGNWHPHAAAAQPSGPGPQTVGQGGARPARAAVAKASAPVWPSAASADVTLSAGGSPVRATGTPLSLSLPAVAAARAADTAAPASVAVHVTVADHAAAQRAGISGVIVSAARTDSGAAAAQMALHLDYSGVRNAFCDSFADRLRLRALPGRVLTPPPQAGCRGQT